MHTLFNGLIKEKFVVLNFAEAFRLHTTTNLPYSMDDSPENVKFLSKSKITIKPGKTAEFPFTWQFPIEQPILNPQEKAVGIFWRSA